MTEYGKLVDGNLEMAPRNKTLEDGSVVLNFDKNTELMVELGYKPIERCPNPGYPYIVSYEEQEDRIVEIKTEDTEAEQREIERKQRELAEKSLTKREVFLALYDNKGITPEQIRAQISDTRALIEFDYAERYYRGNPLITQLGLLLGYTSEQLDELFLTGHFPEVTPVTPVEPESTVCFVCGNDPCTCNDEPENNNENDGEEEIDDDNEEEPIDETNDGEGGEETNNEENNEEPSNENEPIEENQEETSNEPSNEPENNESETPSNETEEPEETNNNETDNGESNGNESNETDEPTENE